MPRMKFDETDFDVNELEEAEYDESKNFQRYAGPNPRDGDLLPGYISKMWLSWTNATKPRPMLVVLFVADETAGKFEGLPIFERIAIQPNTKFRWFPFLNALGLNIREVNTKMVIAGDDEEDERYGIPVIKIANFKPGQDENSAYLRAMYAHHTYDETRQHDAQNWLPYEADDEEASPNGQVEDEPEERPTRRRSAARSSTTRAQKPGSKRRTEPEEEEEEPPEDEYEEEGEEEAEEEAPTKARGRSTPARGRGAGAAGGRGASSRATGRGRGGRRGSSEDPPF